MIGINIPSYPNPFDSSNPCQNAFAWIDWETMDGASNDGRFSLAIHPSAAAAAAGSPPIAHRVYSLGQVLATNGDQVSSVPSYADLKNNAQFVQAFGTIVQILIQSVLADPELSGATVITG